MIKTTRFSLLTLNKFDFGNRLIHQLVVIEIKSGFSIIFFWFHKSNHVQDRFHTHAFNSLSIKLFGEYEEHVLLDEESGNTEIIHRTQTFKYFPRDSYHAIGKSRRGCLTVLIAGPWQKHWKEWIGGEVKKYSWSREEVS